MPLQPGKSKQVMDQNFHEFRHGQTFQKTAAKFGQENIPVGLDDAFKAFIAQAVETAGQPKAAKAPQFTPEAEKPRGSWVLEIPGPNVIAHPPCQLARVPPGCP